METVDIDVLPFKLMAQKFAIQLLFLNKYMHIYIKNKSNYNHLFFEDNTNILSEEEYINKVKLDKLEISIIDKLHDADGLYLKII